MNAKISIIVPVYNVKDYLEKCLDSIINQTYKNLEIIIVDDGSTDGSGAICDAYSQKDGRFIVIHQQNSGQSIARNNALDIATGDYIGFVDSDDSCKETMFESMHEFMEQNDVEIVICGTNRVEPTGNRETEYFNETRVIPNKEAKKLILEDIIGSQPWDKLFKADLWRGVRLPEHRIYEDIATTYKSFFKTEKDIGYICKPFYNYTIRKTSTSYTKCKEQVNGLFQSFEERIDFSKKYLPESTQQCIENTARFAFGVIKQKTVYNEENTFIVTKAKQFLKGYKKNILNLYFPHNKKLLMQAYVYYSSPKLFHCIVKLFKRSNIFKKE